MNRPIRVLVIDDNLAILEDYKKILNSQPESHAEMDLMEEKLFGKPLEPTRTTILNNVEVTTATQGRDGLQQILANLRMGRRFDIAFIDMRMPPGWDGLRTIHEIWKVHADQKIVLATAFSDHSIEEIHSDLGPCPNLLLLKKPFDPDEIRQVVYAFSKGQPEQELSDMEHAVAIHNAIGSDEFKLYFQPIIDLQTRDLVGFEALARWIRDGQTVLPPNEFIRIAEENDLMSLLGTWIAEEAIAFTASLPSSFEGKVTLNASALQLNPGFTDHVSFVTNRFGLSPAQIGIEVTESKMGSKDELVIETLTNLRAQGFPILIDDFGTGFSSLHSLASLPFDTIKIDRAFCVRLVDDPVTAEIAATVVRLAKSLGKTCVAEGIETPIQEALLRDLGCEMAQGFLYSRPVPADVARAWVETQKCPWTRLAA